MKRSRVEGGALSGSFSRSRRRLSQALDERQDREQGVCGICEKPRVRCGDCPNQAFLPVTEQILLDYLQGRHVVGVYPMLHNESCWFLAVDFDKGAWTEDVGAFLETCRRNTVPTSLERSRSGNGAHVWIFFTDPISASSARRMGCYLITETMVRRHQLSMKSYDRLFPSQDTMPRGGFGNLIALPLQSEPRKLGNTVFLDDQLKVHPDHQKDRAPAVHLRLRGQGTGSLRAA